ncbi:MAG: tRNA adenosine(34) deaminase TadA [Christensenellaceae bacterium]|jgi:tRNA(adenine34) deaminase|nr:tRNA adenosine(34) deaminase TadA [Christensenellaceae bacterium]
MYKDFYMQMAIAQAKKAELKGDVPVGAIIVLDGIILAKAFNQKEKYNDPTQHAEIVAIRKATAKIGSWNLDNADIYVTLEPCLMCAGALLAARVRRLFFGAWDTKYGCFGSLLKLSDFPFNHKLEIEGGIMEHECKTLLTDFFKAKRC